MLRDREFFEKRGFVVEAEATPRCNLACPYCDHRPGGEANAPGMPELDLGAAARFLAGTFRGVRFSVVLNGGEPTLRPELPRFCEDVMSVPGASVEVLTNLTAPDEVYRRILASGAEVVPTFHEEAFSPEEFAAKTARLGISKALVPCTPANSARAEELLRKIPGAGLEPLEDGATPLREAARLSRLDPSAGPKFRQLVRSRAGGARECLSGRRYAYLDGDCSVRRCMFTDEPPVWDVRKGPMDLGLLAAPVRCGEWCTYGF